MPFISFVPVQNGRAADAVYLGEVLITWLKAVGENKALRAELKRADLAQVMQTRALSELFWPCQKAAQAGGAYLDRNRLAAIAVLVPRVEADGKASVGTFLHSGGLSESRLKALLSAPDLASFVRSMRSALDISRRSKLSPDPRELASVVYGWDSDYVRRNLAMTYYGAAFDLETGTNGDTA